MEKESHMVERCLDHCLYHLGPQSIKEIILCDKLYDYYTDKEISEYKGIIITRETKRKQRAKTSSNKKASSK